MNLRGENDEEICLMTPRTPLIWFLISFFLRIQNFVGECQSVMMKIGEFAYNELLLIFSLCLPNKVSLSHSFESKSGYSNNEINPNVG